MEFDDTVDFDTITKMFDNPAIGSALLHSTLNKLIGPSLVKRVSILRDDETMDNMVLVEFENGMRVKEKVSNYQHENFIARCRMVSQANVDRREGRL